MLKYSLTYIKSITFSGLHLVKLDLTLHSTITLFFVPEVSLFGSKIRSKTKNTKTLVLALKVF